MVKWVLDKSVTMARCFEDGKTEGTDALVERLAEESAASPQIWPLEVANGLAMAVRRGRISITERAQFLEMLERLPVVLDDKTARHTIGETLRLAEQYGLSVYGAAYLELARRLGVESATVDQVLQRAAVEAGVAVLR